MNHTVTTQMTLKYLHDFGTFRLSDRQQLVNFMLSSVIRHITNIATQHFTDLEVALMAVSANDSNCSTAPLLYRILLTYSTVIEFGHSDVLQ